MGGLAGLLGALGPHDVNTIYVSVASAADVSAVQREISGLLPGHHRDHREQPGQ